MASAMATPALCTSSVGRIAVAVRLRRRAGRRWTWGQTPCP